MCWKDISFRPLGLKQGQLKKNMVDYDNISDENKTKKILNKFKMTDGTMISDGTQISNTFNEFF